MSEEDLVDNSDYWSLKSVGWENCGKEIQDVGHLPFFSSVIYLFYQFFVAGWHHSRIGQ